jgi:hypothetical protein
MPIGVYGSRVFSDYLLEQGLSTPEKLSIQRNFELFVEEQRTIYAKDKPSRLECIFALDEATAEGYNPKRKCLYELEVPDNVVVTEHNHYVITHYQKTFLSYMESNDEDILKAGVNLIMQYWTGLKNCKDNRGTPLKFEREYLIGSPVKIIKIH